MKRSEYRGAFRRWACWITAAVLLITAVSVGGGIAYATNQTPAQAFTAYYTDSMKGAADGTASFAKEDFSTRWTVNADGAPGATTAAAPGARMWTKPWRFCTITPAPTRALI